MVNKNNDKLENLGWTEALEEVYRKEYNHYKVGRVSVEHKGLYKVYATNGEILAEISGKMKHNALSRADYPAVGDWVLMDRTDGTTGNGIIHGFLPRKSKFSRKVAGNENEEQIIAVNVDYAFICMSLNNDFNLRRLERYVIMAWESGSIPVVLLTKSDLCDEIEEKILEVEATAAGVDILTVSALTRNSLDGLENYIQKGKTVAFLGSSGVGKSTLINRLIGEEILATKEIRDGDDRGRHTTTHRELIVLPHGGIVIDTPGMREFHIYESEEGLNNTFDDIEKAANNCKFNDCQHEAEPECAVKKAIEEGQISHERLNSYNKLKREAAFIARKADLKKQIELKKRLKQRTKVSRSSKKMSY